MWNITSLSMDNFRFNVETVILGTTALLGIFFNSLVFIIFYLKPSMRTFSNRFVLSLSFTHLLQSMFILPTVLVTSVTERWIFGAIWCQANGCLTICLNMASVLSILLIAVDRNFAVNNPLHYSTTITRKRTGVLIASTWLISGIISLPAIFGNFEIAFVPEWHTCAIVWKPDLWNILYGSTLTVIGFLLPLTNIAWIYFSMFKAAKTNSATARKNSVSSHFSEILITVETTKMKGNGLLLRKCSPSRDQDNNNTSSICCFAGECKAVKTGLLVVVSFIVCWFPYFLSILSMPHLHITEWMCFFVTFSSLFSCVVNPYLYVFRNKTSRKFIRKLLECNQCVSKKNSFESRQTLRNNLRIKDNNFISNIRKDSVSSVPPICVLKSSRINTIIPSLPCDIFSPSHHRTKEYTDLNESHANLITNCVNNAQIFTHATKPLLHQDSTSSSDSSEAGLSSIFIDSSYNTQSDTFDWYSEFQRQKTLGNLGGGNQENINR